ncbi:substrate-binding domain-containing protein [Lutibacter sp.]|uniref:substrate-binding domain-containing protein n=1 Tax=Lutibacter sp. TaxID=1925666 RepID=UPI003567FF13
MITIKDIAKEANVSEGTVDRVLHNRGGVSKKTEATIKAILKKHNFSVNPVASALALKNKFHIAALVPDFNDADLFWKSPYLGILKATEDVKNFGTQVSTFKFNQYEKASYLAMFKKLLKTKPSAVLLVPTFLNETKEVVQFLEQLEIPYFFLNIDLEGFNNTAFIGQDSYTAGYIAGKLMHSNQPNLCNFLIIQSRSSITKNNAIFKRIEGFNDYFIKKNVPYKIETLKIENLNNQQETKKAINTYLKKHSDIKGIFVPSSRIYMLVDGMEQQFLENIKLIGFDNTPQNIKCLQNNSVSFLISQKPFDQGYESIRIITDYLIKNKIPDHKIFLPIEILLKENANFMDRHELKIENN